MLKAMMLVDEAERRGDASGALELVSQVPQRLDGQLFWRPWRTQHLSQFAMLGPMLPRWAYSRWILAQAMQWLDDGFQPRAHSALRTAIDVRGGAAAVPGRNLDDARARVMDHDWVFRQLVLFELGKLERFCRKRVAVDLLVGADDLAAWSRASMNAYWLIEREPGVLTWQGVRSGELLRTPNTGCASMLWPGDAVIGRMVPIDGGQLFESAPLWVSDAVAREVARDPDSWIDVLRESGEYGEAVPLTRPTEHDGLLVELYPRLGQNVVCDQPDTFVLRPLAPRELARGAVELGRFMLDGFEPPDFRHLDTWSCLAAAFVEPDVVEELSEHASAADREVLGRLAKTLAEPASAVCGQLAVGGLPKVA